MTHSIAKALTGRAPVETNGNHIQAASSFLTADATASPNTSPLTVSTAVIVLLVPKNAVSVTMYATTNDTRVSEDDGAATYFVLKAGTLASFPCAYQNDIYVVRDGGSDATLQFFFNLI